MASSIDESKLVIACHCPMPTHAPMHYVISNGKQGPALGDTVTYVDPKACPDYTWEKISDRSKQYVWLESCTFTSLLSYENFATEVTPVSWTIPILLAITTECKRILQPGGQMIIPVPNHYNTSHVGEVFNYPEFQGFTLEIKESQTHELWLAKAEKGWKPRPVLIIFTKHQEGGKRRTRRTRRTRRKHRSKRK